MRPYMTNQVTTVSICDFTGPWSRFFALMNMALLLPRISGVKGLKFIKLMGSGGGNGFAFYPHWGRYAILAVWDNEASQKDFFSTNPHIKKYFARTDKVSTYTLKNKMSHGKWGGLSPFEPDEERTHNAPTAVLTRATIKWKDMLRFWKEVPEASKDMASFPGCLLAIGIGELPFRYQATFSIWSDMDKMKDFAYRSGQHTDMISKTRKTGWYKEELFARFEVLSVSHQMR